MENKIIIRYTWKKEDGHIFQEVVPIECLEGKGDTPFVGNEYWDLVARDLFTGIVDKNDNKIFEGDVVLIDSKEYIVKYGEKTARFFFSRRIEDSTHHIYSIMDRIFTSKEYMTVEPETIEIIGNIHDNK